MDMECRRYENIISAVVMLLSLFSGLLIQLIIYRVFDVRVKDVPIVLIAVLWIGLSMVVTHLVSGIDI
jgi:F0F1-type ATP synthase assembly protein I